MNDPTSLRRLVGNAIWLLELLGQYAPAGWDGSRTVPVASGNLISDVELGVRCEYKPRTIARHRRKLRQLGLVKWDEHGKGERTFYLLGKENQSAGSAQPASLLVN